MFRNVLTFQRLVGVSKLLNITVAGFFCGALLFGVSSRIMFIIQPDTTSSVTVLHSCMIV